MLRFLLLLALLPLSVSAQDLVGIPELRRQVTDLTGTLSDQEIAGIEQKLKQLEAAKGSQIAVLILPSTKPESIEQFSIRLAEKWKIGRAKVDDGAILIVAKQDRRLRIEVGYGLEGALPDAICKRIIDEQIVPRFKADDFAGGIEAGVDAMILRINGEDLPAPVRTPGGETSSYRKGKASNYFGIIVVVLIIGGQFLKAMMNRFAAGLIVGGAGFVAGLLFVGLTGGIVLGIIALLATWLFTGSGGSGGGWSSGGWSSGGSSWSSGGSSWSGGGGSFGGGGSSGSW